MRPTIYVAGSSRHLERARRAMDAAERLGFALLYDWALFVELNGGRANEGLDPQAAELSASACLDAAIGADVLWCLLDPELRSPGMHVELGARLYTRGRDHILLSGRGPAASIFYTGLAHVPTDEQAAELLELEVEARRCA